MLPLHSRHASCHCLRCHCREAGSADITLDILKQAWEGFDRAVRFGSQQELYVPLRDAVGDVIRWMLALSEGLKPSGFERFESCWSGDQVGGWVGEWQVAVVTWLMAGQCVMEHLNVGTLSFLCSAGHRTAWLGPAENLYATVQTMNKQTPASCVMLPSCWNNWRGSVLMLSSC